MHQQGAAAGAGAGAVQGPGAYGGGILSSAPPPALTMLPSKLTSSLRALNFGAKGARAAPHSSRAAEDLESKSDPGGR